MIKKKFKLMMNT